MVDKIIETEWKDEVNSVQLYVEEKQLTINSL